jgi:hypothetical protein
MELGGFSLNHQVMPREALLPFFSNVPGQVTMIEVGRVEFCLPEGIHCIKPTASQDLLQTFEELVPRTNTWAASSEAASDTDLQVSMQNLCKMIQRSEERCRRIQALKGSFNISLQPSIVPSM